MDNNNSKKNTKPAQAQAKTRDTTRRSHLPFAAASLQPHASFAARVAAGSWAASSKSRTAGQSLRRVSPIASPRARTTAATAPTNASRQRQGNVGPNDRAASQRSYPSASGASSASVNSRRPTSEKPSVRASVRESRSSTSTARDDRPLPPLPRTPPHQLKSRQSLPPPGPLSRRPLLPLKERPSAQSGAIAPSSSKAASSPFEPRRFHMHGQTYDDAMAPLKAKAKAKADAARAAPTEPTARPASRSTQLARIGPLTNAEKARSDGQSPARQGQKGTDVKKGGSVVRQPAPKQATARQPAPSGYKAAEEQERRQLLRQSLQLRKPELWTPKYSSPLRQSHPTPSSPRPDSAEISPMTPPPRSPVSSSGPRKKAAEKAAEKQAAPVAASPLATPAAESDELLAWDIEVIKASRVKTQTEIYENDEPLLGYNVEALKQSSGWGDEQDEPLLEWDIEAIKASLTRTFRKPAPTLKRGKATKKKTVRFGKSTCSSASSSSSSTNTHIRWAKDPGANRAVDASSSTAVPFLIKALDLLPTPTKAKYGVVAIDTVVQKRPQITTSRHSGSDDDAGSACGVLAAEQCAELQYTGDYTSSWPESAYYFGECDSGPAMDASPAQPHEQSVATTRTSTSENSRWQAYQRRSSQTSTHMF